MNKRVNILCKQRCVRVSSVPVFIDCRKYSTCRLCQVSDVKLYKWQKPVTLDLTQKNKNAIMKITKRKNTMPDTQSQPNTVIPIKANTDGEVTLPNLAILTKLSPHQRAVIKELAQNAASNIIQTDAEVARKVGITARTITSYRVTPMFGQALATVLMGVIAGKTEIYLRYIEKAAEKDWRAAKFLYEVVGIYVPKKQILSMHIDAGSMLSNTADIDSMIDTFLVKLNQLGWSADRLVARFNEVNRRTVNDTNVVEGT